VYQRCFQTCFLFSNRKEGRPFMLIQLDYTDGRPIYEQIKDGIKKLILMNVLMPDEKLQSVRSLAMDLSTNPNTVQRAYSDLEREGYIYTVPGKGNFVRKNVNLKSEKARELRTEIEDILKQADELGIDRYELLRGL
jgi:GntR family transcriptional regulator